MKAILFFIGFCIFLVSCTDSDSKPDNEVKDNKKTNSDTVAITDKDSLIDESEEIELKYESEINFILMGDSKYLTFYGGVKGDTWLSPDELLIDITSDNHSLSVFVNGSYLEDYFLNPEEGSDEYCDCSDFMLDADGLKGDVVAISGPWDIYDFEVIETSEHNDRANKILSDHISAHGFEGAVVEVETIKIFDFDGDGLEDAIIEHTYHELNENHLTAAGSYSVILFVSDFLDEAITTSITTNVFTEVAPSEIENLTPDEIVDWCDLNGDNIPELIIYGGYYEGGGEDIYTFRDGRFHGVLSCLCGA